MKDARKILSESSVRTAAETFAVVSLEHGEWLGLLARPELSPRMSAPFMFFYDGMEVTMLLDEKDLAAMAPGLAGARIARGYRLMTFDAELSLDVVGFLAEISGLLAAAGIPVIALSAFSRDHLLIEQNDLAAALKALGPHVGELC